MIDVKLANTWGVAQVGPVTVRCHFAFADVCHAGLKQGGHLRALNAVQLAAKQTYELGPEAAVDIVTWVHSGSLTAQMNGFDAQTLAPQGLHLASTGSGCSRIIWQSGTEGAVFYQIWLLADVAGTTPEQETRPAQLALEDGGFRILASGFPEDDPEEGAEIEDGAPVTLYARARVLHTILPEGEGAAYCTTPQRMLLLLVVEGVVTLGQIMLHAGDTATLREQTDLTVIAQSTATVLLIDAAEL
ncbi:pirin [Acetobacter orientalis]|uniref:Pirin n=1 Tax=Acetobacter orientalis TaxID=146474 RepID=A0A252B4T8_9PROT|nr:hypothetical protein [Acetobacter orientalis]OUI99277.1 pirin [Acetobacter orientalis]